MTEMLDLSDNDFNTAMVKINKDTSIRTSKINQEKCAHVPQALEVGYSSPTRIVPAQDRYFGERTLWNTNSAVHCPA